MMWGDHDWDRSDRRSDAQIVRKRSIPELLVVGQQGVEIAPKADRCGHVQGIERRQPAAGSGWDQARGITKQVNGQRGDCVEEPASISYAAG